MFCHLPGFIHWIFRGTIIWLVASKRGDPAMMHGCNPEGLLKTSQMQMRLNRLPGSVMGRHKQNPVQILNDNRLRFLPGR